MPGVPSNRRVYTIFGPAVNGRVTIRLSALDKPSMGDSVATLISRGLVMDGATELSFNVVTDPSADPTLKGADGKSAYQLARDGGYSGTTAQWLASLVGAKGDPGKDAAATLCSITLADPALSITAGVKRLIVNVPTGVTLAVTDKLWVQPKVAPLQGVIVQGAWFSTSTKVAVDLTVPLITGGYSIDCWLLRFSA